MSSAEGNSTAGRTPQAMEEVYVARGENGRSLRAGVFVGAAKAIDAGTATTRFACHVICDEARVPRHVECAESLWFFDTFRPQTGVADYGVGLRAFFSSRFTYDSRLDNEANARDRVIALLFAAAIAEGGGL